MYLVLHEHEVLLFPLEVQCHILGHLVQEILQTDLQLLQALLLRRKCF